MKVKKAVLSLFALVAVLVALPLQLNLTEGKVVAEGPKEDGEEVLWLARAVYSETKRKNEQLVIACVIRNRVESQYRGATYKQVVLSDSQFSGLQPADQNYKENIGKKFEDTDTSWQSAVNTARAVYEAEDPMCPIPSSVQHFYSPMSVVAAPDWAAKEKLVLLIKEPGQSSARFAFYQGVK